MLAGYFSIKQNLDNMEGGFFEFFGFGNVPASTIIYAVIFVILGYFLYATMAAFLGSLVSRIEDVQQMITPMTMLVIAGFMMAMFGLSQPDAPFVKYTSFIPFFSPMLMFLRVGMLNVPLGNRLIDRYHYRNNSLPGSFRCEGIPRRSADVRKIQFI